MRARMNSTDQLGRDLCWLGPGVLYLGRDTLFWTSLLFFHATFTQAAQLLDSRRLEDTPQVRG